MTTKTNIIHIEDELNLKNFRNIKNTEKRAYNCGGYALGTFSWYLPFEFSTWWDFEDDEDKFEKMEKLTEDFVDYMLKDFSDLRVISKISDLKKNEYAIAFKVSSDGDFHYVKRQTNGVWRHKRGAMSRIEYMSIEEVFHEDWCYGRYDGPLVLLAKRK